MHAFLTRAATGGRPREMWGGRFRWTDPDGRGHELSWRGDQVITLYVEVAPETDDAGRRSWCMVGASQSRRTPAPGNSVMIAERIG